MVIIKSLGVAVLVPLAFVLAVFFRNAARGVATGQGALAGVLTSPLFLVVELLAVSATVYFGLRH